MPLSPAGNRTLSKFIQEYGEKRGKAYFYGKENKGGAFARAVRKYKPKTK